MGGYGSTRWNLHWKKTTVEECKQLPISLFYKPIRHVLEHPDEGWKGDINWSYNGNPSGKIGYVVVLKNSIPEITLQYTVVKSGKEMDYPIRLTTTDLYWGDKRWWFICPLIKNGKPCFQRVGKLYLPPGYEYFGCRNCYELTYTSCQESHKYDSLFKKIGLKF